jgi:GH15 family glucan-1,4-alpha-glucosidase
MAARRPPSPSSPSARREVPLEEYVLLGDTRTAALVADGSIDWLCLPRFDSAPVFGRLIGGPDVGWFRIAPVSSDGASRSGYLPGSAVAQTTWETPEGRARLTDGLVTDVSSELLPSFLLVRRLEALDEPVEVVVEFVPRRGRSRQGPDVSFRDGAAVCTWGDVALAVTIDPGVRLHVGGSITVVVAPERPLTVCLAAADRQPLVYVPPSLGWQRLTDTDRWWRSWSDGFEPLGVGDDAVSRSLITLRMLTYAPSGAPLAAPTTSLPERLGGDLNWDYRYSWPRDASIGTAASLAAGIQPQADAFLYWLLHAGRVNRPQLPPAMSVDGRETPGEERWEDWPGYAASRPVRSGNAAARQHQLDGYGWVVDAIWQYHRVTGSIFSETWRLVVQLADHVTEVWREPDAGIWERRDDPRHYVFSKLMAWLALDRAIRLAAERDEGGRRTRRWVEERDELAAEIRRRGFDHERGTYVQDYDSRDLDAALLLLPVVGFDPSESDRVRGTIDTIRAELSAGDPLLFRFTEMAGQEGAFLPCSFWLVQALAKTGRTEEARRVFDHLLSLASPAGLFPEEVDPDSGWHLGNTPMVFTHGALIQAAMAIRDAENDGGGSGGQEDAE